MILDNLATSLVFVTTTTVLSDSTADCDTISIGTGESVFWFFEASRSGIKRSGLYMTTWNADSSAADLVVLATDSYDEYGLGDSTDLAFALVIEGGNVILRAISVNNWTITVKRLKI